MFPRFTKRLTAILLTLVLVTFDIIPLENIKNTIKGAINAINSNT